MSDLTALAAQCASSAEFYRTYAARFAPGTLGYTGNMAEAAKYADGRALRIPLTRTRVLLSTRFHPLCQRMSVVERIFERTSPMAVTHHEALTDLFDYDSNGGLSCSLASPPHGTP